jgi:hypothetical protein
MQCYNLETLSEKKNLIFKNKIHLYKRFKKKTSQAFTFFFLLQLGWMTCSLPQIFWKKTDNALFNLPKFQLLWWPKNQGFSFLTQKPIFQPIFVS